MQRTLSSCWSNLQMTCPRWSLQLFDFCKWKWEWHCKSHCNNASLIFTNGNDSAPIVWTLQMQMMLSFLLIFVTYWWLLQMWMALSLLWIYATCFPSFANVNVVLFHLCNLLSVVANANNVVFVVDRSLKFSNIEWGDDRIPKLPHMRIYGL
jgi:hypothetical protein